MQSVCDVKIGSCRGKKRDCTKLTLKFVCIFSLRYAMIVRPIFVVYIFLGGGWLFEGGVFRGKDSNIFLRGGVVICFWFFRLRETAFGIFFSRAFRISRGAFIGRGILLSIFDLLFFPGKGICELLKYFGEEDFFAFFGGVNFCGDIFWRF